MEIDLGNGVKMKDVNAVRERRRFIMRICGGLSILFFLLKVTIWPGMSPFTIMMPIWIGASVFLLLFLCKSLIMRFAKDF